MPWPPLWAIAQSNNQIKIFHYTRCITLKRVTSLRGPSPRHCARAPQLFSMKCRSGGELLATLCPIRPTRDLNLRPPSPETNALPLEHCKINVNMLKSRIYFFRWSICVEKAYAILHFSIILISLMVGVVQVVNFFWSCHFFSALKSFSTQIHHLYIS